MGTIWAVTNERRKDTDTRQDGHQIIVLGKTLLIRVLRRQVHVLLDVRRPNKARHAGGLSQHEMRSMGQLDAGAPLPCLGYLAVF